MTDEPFSRQLERWLTDKRPKTFQRVGEVFGAKSFATLFLLLMITPALPLPTGGITHIFEIITVILAVGYMTGRESVWIPQRWQDRNLGHLAGEKVLPRLLKIVRPIENFSRPRLSYLLESLPGRFAVGLLIILFTVFAFVAPPFSGLDTLPALGVVFIALGLLFGDIVIVGFGAAVGSAGVALVVILGGALLKSFHLF